jgi:hypothetical protein
MPAVTPLTTNTQSFMRNTGTPTDSAATGLSRMAISPRPHIVRATFQVIHVIRTAMPSRRK